MVEPAPRPTLRVIDGLRATDRLRATGLGTLGADPAPEAVLAVVREWAELVAVAPMDEQALERGLLIQSLEQLGLRAPARLVDAALEHVRPSKPNGLRGQTVALADPEFWPEPVEGMKLLNDISAWFRSLVWLPEGSADAIALWAAATWFVDELYFAPLLILQSATKRCGKTLALDLLRPIVRRGYQTSAVGVTAPVVFRLNESKHPTFLIDEAEKLGGRNASRELVGMLNVGYRRGSHVCRCVDVGGGYETRSFDAFGFRALASIGSLWDTLTDRAVIISMERKPESADVTRFNGRRVAQEGAKIGRRLYRWACDNASKVSAAESNAPRPSWLNDRDCDNWSGLFAVANVAGSDWPERAERAARALSKKTDEARDYGERLIHDIRAVFEAQGWPEVIKSGDLCPRLNAIETSPWGDYRNGNGYNAHKLASMLRPFGIVPRQSRPEGGGIPVRGYWKTDLQPVFTRYPTSELVQSVQASSHAGFQEIGSGTGNGVRTTSPSAENGSTMRFVPDVPPRTRVQEEDQRYLLDERAGMRAG